MKKIIKGLFCIFALAIAFTFLGNQHAFAATVGQALTAPEEGWQRIDDKDSRITYTGTWTTLTNTSCYNGSSHYNYSTESQKSIKFTFVGTKIRIIQYKNPWTGLCNIKIDNVDYGTINSICNSSIFQILTFEATGLTSGTHSVEMYGGTTNTFNLDAIDIDSNGYIVDPSVVLSTGIALNKTVDSLTVGQTDTLTATVTPDNATNKTVTWKSSNPSIASVDSNGVITGIAAGSTVITATTTDGSNLSVSCTVNVTEANRAILTVYLINGSEKEYDLSASELNAFLTWYDNRSSGNGSQYYVFNKTYNKGPFLNRKNYISYDKILDFDVDEYTPQ